MRLPDNPQEKDDGKYHLPKEHVINTLKNHKISVKKIDGDSLVLMMSEENQQFIVVVLPERVPARMIFELASHFGFQADDFYLKNG